MSQKPTDRIRASVAPLETYLRTGARADVFLESYDVNAAGKHSIATYIARELGFAGILVLDAGSTGFEIAKAIPAWPGRGTNLHVFTNNLAAALYLGSSGVTCTLLGGKLDPSHFCTLPTKESLGAIIDEPYQVIVTAASIMVCQKGITIRSRSRDQFEFKQALLLQATTRILAVDHTKWTLPFPGQCDFLVREQGLHIVVDEVPETGQGASSFVSICRELGHHVHVAEESNAEDTK